MNAMKLLVDAGEFWDSFAADARAAKESVYVQTLSFEGDAVGSRLAGALHSSGAPDRRLLVDHYSKWIQSDRFLYTPANLLDAGLRRESRISRRLVRDLEDAGVGVRFINPVGIFLRRIAGRNHKKLLTIDDRIVYIGGINFSDHNFLWHDAMLRIEHPEVAAFCARDVRRTWEGRDVSESRDFPGLRLLLMNGRDNHPLFAEIFQLIAEADREIVVESPYLSFPFTGALGDAVRRGVRVRIISPAANNKPIMRRYIAAEAARYGFELYMYPGMSHLKGMLIDGSTVVIGSSNFDYLSLHTHQEVVAIVTDPELVADFSQRIIAADLAASEAAVCVPERWDTSRKTLRAVSAFMAGLARW